MELATSILFNENQPTPKCSPAFSKRWAMQHNVETNRVTARTHEGGPAAVIKPYDELRRTVLNCLLWEDTFYEDGVAIADRIKTLCQNARISISQLAGLATEARTVHHLRHVPLILLVHAARRPRTPRENKELEASLVTACDRPDQITEFLSLYWKEGKCPLTHWIKRGLGKALARFSAYHLGKYNRDKPIKLRDVMFLVHAKPHIAAYHFTVRAPAISKPRYKRGETSRHNVLGASFAKLADNTLESPDTWEVRLSAAGKSCEETKKQVWEDLLQRGKLGDLALLRNLRNMREEKVDESLISAVFSTKNFNRIWPYQFIAAATHAPWAEPMLEPAMMKAAASLDKLSGKTLLLVDVSGSMNEEMSGKSKMKRFDAAAGLAVLLREIGETDVFSFNTQVTLHPPRHGFALRDSLKALLGGGTYLGNALARIAKEGGHYARVIVITDEQSSDRIRTLPSADRYYIINVASYQNGVSTKAGFVKIDGFSENVVRYIAALETNKERWG